MQARSTAHAQIGQPLLAAQFAIVRSRQCRAPVPALCRARRGYVGLAIHLLHLLKGRVVHIVRYRRPGSNRDLVGSFDGDRVRDVPVSSLAELWSFRLSTLRTLVDEVGGDGYPIEEVEVLAPIDGRTEVWACGVTYEISREARVEESEGAKDAYELVYDADRPELFFKSAAWRVVADGGAVAIRSDSTLDVPEPEVALVINRFGQIVGYTVCDDVSSRSIEGENPLYLPQAKIYLGSCALGPMVRPVWEVADPYALGIELTIRRAGAVTWHGTASTAQLHRKYEDSRPLPDACRCVPRRRRALDGHVSRAPGTLQPRSRRPRRDRDRPDRHPEHRGGTRPRRGHRRHPWLAA